MQKDYLVDDRYRIVSVLGKGGTSTVYLAENIKLGTLWAIKEINKRSVSRMDLLAEPNILKRLSHPSLPRIVDITENDESIFIIVDYIEGNTLDVELQEKGCISEEMALAWAKQLCEALIYLHDIKPNPIIYRDLKPSNIILGKDGRVRLIDFGTAREYKEESETDTVYIGTRGYAAPEQYGLGQTDVTTDIFGLGITLFHLITGKSPNSIIGEIKSIRCHNPKISKEIEEILCKCIKYNPAERYQTACELLEDIESLQSSREKKNTYKVAVKKPYDNELNTSANRVSFKKLVLSFIGNGEFASNFAYLAAKMSHFKVAIVDLDSLNPMCDYHLNPKHGARMQKTKNILQEDSGINLILERLRGNGSLSSEEIEAIAMQRMEVDNLYIFTGNRCWNKYGKYSKDEVKKLIDVMYRDFDLTVLALNSSVKEPYTETGVNHSDYIIAGQRPYSDEICSSMRAMEYFCDEFDIDSRKIKYVLYDVKPTGLEENFIRNEGFGLGDSLIGSIRHTEKYEKYRNRKAFYMRCAETEVIKDYQKLLQGFNIVPKRKIYESFSLKLHRMGKILKSGFTAKI